MQAPPSGQENDALNDLISSEKIRIVCRNTPMILAGNLLGSVPLAIVLWSFDQPSILVWLMSLYLILLMRLLYNRVPQLDRFSPAEFQRYDHGQAFLILITGCTWGAGGYLYFDVENIQTVLMIVLTFVSMIAGSLVSLSSRPFLYVLFATPVMGPVIFAMFIQDEWAYNWLGFGAVIYLAATFGFSRTIHKVIDNSIRLRYENLDLIEDLRHETERANQANTEKSRFLASASHDLRQPLQAVNLFTEVLSTKLRDSDQKADIANIQSGLTSLNELLDALFDVSKLDSASIQPRPESFSMDDILSRLERQFMIEAHMRGLAFSVAHSDSIVVSDPLLIERVITNLLVNAFRYTSKGSVKVHFSETPDTITLHVTDTGIGIPEESLECIFKEFFQVNNQERDKRQGLGLGLAIVRRILTLLNHPIHVTSEVGRGSTFSIELPRGQRKSASAGSPAAIPNVTSLKGMSVLVVDNEEAIVDAMCTLLTSWEAEPAGYTDTLEALNSVARGDINPQFAIVDYRMPGEYNGVQFVSELRDLLPVLPALIITGDTSEDVVQEFREHKLDYLHKPIKPARLRMYIERILSRQP